jgi:hypothetical protein
VSRRLTTMQKLIKVKPVMDARMCPPCDHIRQYFEAGRPMPCANPYCVDSTKGDGLVSFALKSKHFLVPPWYVKTTYQRVRHDKECWSWELESQREVDA